MLGWMFLVSVMFGVDAGSGARFQGFRPSRPGRFLWTSGLMMRMLFSTDPLLKSSFNSNVMPASRVVVHNKVF